MKILKKIAVFFLILFVVMQFIRPEKNLAQGNHTEQFITETNPPDRVLKMLQQSCYDCHSNHTTYPWYADIAPVSFWIAEHVEKGKRHLNFSEWETYETRKKDHKLEELMEEVEGGEMPLRPYNRVHQNAHVGAEQKKALSDWVERTRALYQLNSRPN